MRLSRSSGLQGLAGMAEATEFPGASGERLTIASPIVPHLDMAA